MTARAGVASEAPRGGRGRTGGRAGSALLARALSASPATLVLVLAAGLRFFRLDGQSFWYDEGVTAGMVGRSPGQILEAAAGDIHPPLYYLLVAAWGSLLGRGEVALRSLSALIGLLLVAAVWLLGRRLFGPRPALGAALLLAVSPLGVYYAQEARMYGAVTLFGALAALAYVHWLGDAIDGRGERRRAAGWTRLALVGYVLAAAATIYTQYFGLLVLAALNLHALIILRGRRLLAWLTAQAAVALLYLPWLPVPVRAFFTWPGLGSSGPPDALLRDALVVLAFGTTADRASPGLDVLLYWGLAAAGIALSTPFPFASAGLGLKPAPATGRAGLHARLLAALLLLVPLLGLLALALRRPAYEPKFLLLALPGLALLAGRGAAALVEASPHAPPPLTSRREGSGGSGVRAITLLAMLGLLVALAPPTVRSLASYYFDPRYARDDYRGIAARIAAAARPGDAVLLDAPGQAEVFGLYYRGPLPVYPLPRQRPIDPADTRAQLAAIADQHDRLWLVLWASEQADPDGLILTWLNERAFPTEDSWYGGVRLLRYALASAAAEPEVRLDLRLDNGADLLGYTLLADRVAAGDVLPITLFWRAREPMAGRYKVFTHLLDGRDFIAGQRDAEPGADRRPTTGWRPGEVIADNYGIPVLPGTPPGEYWVEVGMYALEGGQRPRLRDAAGADRGDHLKIGPVQVTRPERPPDPATLGYRRPVGHEVLPGLTLLGYDLHPIGADPGQPPRRGEEAQLTLYWRADRAPGRDLLVRAELLDAAGQPRASATAPPGGQHAPSQWQDGEVVRDPHRLSLRDLPAGRYTLRLVPLDPSGAPLGAPLELGALDL